MSKISNLIDLEPYFPNLLKLQREWKSPCPFCPEESGRVFSHSGRDFVGEDRLVWFIGSNRVYCRECQRQDRGKNGTYGLRDLTVKLGLEVGTITRQEYAPLREPLTIWSKEEVATYHDNVDRDYWNNLGWPNELIDRFRLGKGYVSGFTHANTIPMAVREVGTDTIISFYGSGRQDGDNRKLRGSISYYVWEIINNPSSTTVLIAEGEKDAITLAWLYPEYNVIASFGATFWDFSKTVDLIIRGYKDVWVFQDNDRAGLDFSSNIVKMSVTRALPLSVKTLLWEDLEGNFKDVTEGLSTLSKDDLRDALSKIVHTPYSGVESQSTPQEHLFSTPLQETEIVSLEDIRSVEGEFSLRERINTFISTYASSHKRGKGQLQLISAPPGAGKTYSMVKLAEEFAFQRQIEHFTKKAELQREIGRLEPQVTTEDEQKWVEKLKRDLSEYSFTSVAWLGQYKEGFNDLELMSDNPSLWYNFEARNEDNCRNLNLVAELGQNNHNIGSFCKVGCQFRESCLESGYLKQETEMKDHPITFLRHQHLASSLLTREKYDLVVVDENPTSVVETPIFANESNMVIHDNLLLGDNPELKLLCDAVRATMAICTPVPVVSGSKFLHMLTKQTLLLSEENHDLQTLLAEVPSDLIEQAQPNHISGEIVLLRVLPQLIKAIIGELPDFLDDPDNEIPSAINVVYGRLELYTREVARIPQKTPIVVLDATAFPKLYEGMFARQLQVYRPAIRNAKAKVTVLTGSDFTKSQVNRELGGFYKDLDSILEETKVTNLLGEIIDLSDIQGDPHNIFESPVLRQTYQLAKTISERHGDTLVVTHKVVRRIMEATTDIPHVSWGHYGSLRGTNRYENFPAVLLVGAYRIPYDVVYRKVSYWARLLGWLDPIDPELVKKEMLYHDTIELGAYVTYNNMLLDQYIHMVEAGELIQSAERIRPHSSSVEKFVYIAANRPALNYVSVLDDKRDFLEEAFGSKGSDVYKFMKEHYGKQGRFPTYTSVVNEFHVGRSIISETRKQILEEENEEQSNTEEAEFYDEGSIFAV